MWRAEVVRARGSGKHAGYTLVSERAGGAGYRGAPVSDHRFGYIPVSGPVSRCVCPSLEE